MNILQAWMPSRADAAQCALLLREQRHELTPAELSGLGQVVYRYQMGEPLSALERERALATYRRVASVVMAFAHCRTSGQRNRPDASNGSTRNLAGLPGVPAGRETSYARR